LYFFIAKRHGPFTDLIQHFRPKWFRGWRAIVAGLDLMVAAEPSVPRKFRAAFTDRRAARALFSVSGMGRREGPMAHGDPVTEGGQAFIHRAFRWLGDQ
jgi:hypothetical protein